MTDAIAALVTSLGDFPLDPDAGKAWLWAGGGDRLLWASQQARGETRPDAPADAALVRSFAPLLALPAPDREPIRVHQLAPGQGPRAAVHTCLCRHVPLTAGGFGLLAVAIGAPARSMAAVRGEPEAPQEPDQGPLADLRGPIQDSKQDSRPDSLRRTDDGNITGSAGGDSSLTAAELGPAESTTIGDSGPAPGHAIAEIAESEAPEPETQPAETPAPETRAPENSEPETREPEPPPAPAWTGLDPGDRTPIRFVWQTDADGRFVHISRELADAVGADNALVLGRTWVEFAREAGLSGAQPVADGFQSRDTWTAAPALWPVANAELAVPVEMAGLRVLENGRFDGFRGYGIARIERAAPRPTAIVELLAPDAAGDAPVDDDPDLSEVTYDLARVEPRIAIGERIDGEQALGGEQAHASEHAHASGQAHASEHAPGGAPEPAAKSAAEAPATSAETEAWAAEAAAADAPAEETPQERAEPPVEAGAAPVAALAPRLQPYAPQPDAGTPGAPAPDEQTSPLSAVEREAFREIAKALGAMTGHLGRPAPQVPPPQTSPPQTSPPQTSLPQVSPPPALPELTPAPPRDVRPLEIITRDVVRLAAAPEPGAPIDFQQARRDRQSAADPVPAAGPPAALLPAAISPTDNLEGVDPLASAAPALLDAVPCGLLVMRQHDAVFANRHLLDLIGYPDLAAFVAAGGVQRLFAPGTPDASANPRRFEIAGRSGASVAVEAQVQPIVWAGASAALMTLRAADPALLARQKALELDVGAARAELQELRSVLDTATDGVILLDRDGRILSLNRSAEALFGFDQNEMAGESLTALLEPDSHVAALDYIEGLRSNGVNSILNDGRDVRGRERNGGAIPLFMTIGRVGERDGGARFCAVLRDVTHWKKVEADLMEAKRAAEDANAHKSDFLARISHEVRTPLNAIIGFSQVMMSESFGPIGNDRYRQYAKDIHASGEHVVSLVNDLLDLSKIAAGRLDLAFGSVDVNAVVAESVAMIQPQANAGRVIVRSQLAVDLPPVVADERSLRQVMLNLLSNASKFTEGGGQVVASTSLTENGEVVIRVSDTGIGMADDEVRRAMEPFRQIPGPRSGGGTGLGLPLTKALVEANRAAFAIRSEPRKGTLVEVVFPSTRVLAE